MSSDLFRRALGSLSKLEQEAFERWTEWLESHGGFPPSRPAKGERILMNLQAEAHLVGDGAFGDSAEMADFLRRCAARFIGSTSIPERHRHYQEVCQEFARRGLPLLRGHLPDDLLRYTSSRTLSSTLIQRILGKRARDAFDRESLPPEAAFTRLRDRWAPNRLEAGDRLVRGDKVFASFEHPAGAPRNDAAALSRALALPLWQGPRTGLEILIELEYSTDAVENHRFPTVADAEWIHLFLPAPEEVPDGARPVTCCGWTEPLGAYPPQPEIVHDNAPLKVLSGPPRFVGAIV